MTDTWKFLPKAEREALTFADAAYMDMLLEKRQWAAYFTVHSKVALIAAERGRISDDWYDVLIHPYKQWGIRASEKLAEMAHKKNDKSAQTLTIRPQEVRLMDGLTGEEAVMLIKEGDILFLNQCYHILKSPMMSSLDEGQQEFIDVADAYHEQQQKKKGR